MHNAVPIVERMSWARQVLKQIEGRLTPENRIVILADQRYREQLMPELQQRYASVEVPMEGLEFGHQLAWLTQAHNTRTEHGVS